MERDCIDNNSKNSFKKNWSNTSTSVSTNPPSEPTTSPVFRHSPGMQFPSNAEISAGTSNSIEKKRFMISNQTKQTLQRKQAAIERELRLQKSLSEECEDLGVDEPSASDLFPEAEILFDYEEKVKKKESHSSNSSQSSCYEDNHLITQVPLISDVTIPSPLPQTTPYCLPSYCTDSPLSTNLSIQISPNPVKKSPKKYSPNSNAKSSIKKRTYSLFESDCELSTDQSEDIELNESVTVDSFSDSAQSVPARKYTRKRPYKLYVYDENGVDESFANKVCVKAGESSDEEDEDEDDDEEDEEDEENGDENDDNDDEDGKFFFFILPPSFSNFLFFFETARFLTAYS